MINIQVEDNNGDRQELEVPVDMGLNLMEMLKAYEYDIQATCGGMGLCATCHIAVLEGGEGLPELNDNELETLDTLPDAESNSRLACQLRCNDQMNGLVIRLKALQEA
ncbi:MULTISPECIES: 2Fe-2S iron-sulfur cluster-binding protein [Dyadobacter]|jgi:ferredoxin|uniref:(2Fe-2S)-binding protein n=1 Tax=Dyadobacter chenhuakuii TaxID=2909339 RepID=A0A9X1QAE2_9BACT|nr:MULTISPECIES: 2Fe-2S iron-sulfur cluster-binding protein [Dyadobacter]MCE7072398.1 (2Fe-2S)-binding protein [Dyadobacter sp. CY327]MCF2494553.1 (2Fe-2S)-binding protein [Dyadobacter chenhuakuii]MCF2497541.1 (2Fe-2S)-binding protein [Dyadobacter chenhuakuii]MCF2519718.1 (2Fe-2S)-binding protein [Dyadobacter sp. CY351]USJ32124.1 (2Fe-2S)-binding protein [Dyadobacter chenhuakuii]